MDPFLEAFGLPATVSRLAPDDSPIATAGYWLQPETPTAPFGSDLQRLDNRRVFVLPKRDVWVPRLNMIARGVPHAAKGGIVNVAEEEGGTVKNWVIDGYERTESDNLRLYLRPTT